MKKDPQREDVLDLFIDNLPEIMSQINSEIGIENEDIYCVLGFFANRLCEGLSKNAFTNEELDRIFKILNLMGGSSDLEVQNQLVVGILEHLTDNKIYKDVARRMLFGNALTLFEKLFTDWEFKDS